MAEHGAGRLDAAEALYRGLLAERPDEPDALHLYGVLLAQRGRHAEAYASIARAVAVSPDEPMFRNNLGNVCIERGRFEEAEALYRQAMALDPGRVDALNNLGVLLGRRGRADEAEQVLLKVIELAPSFADARQNLANHYLRHGRLGDAVQQCFEGLIVAPRSTALRRMLGVAYSMMGMNEQAIEVYRSWLQSDPGNPIAAFHLQACAGAAVPERAPDAYVEQVFDSFAASFDAKLAVLGYKAPELVLGGVARRLGAPRQILDVLDAGCGTGLCGPLLAPYSRSLCGVDLSGGMLKKALARRVYDELVQGELVEFLQARRAAWDLVVSADTLCYFGRLEACVAAAAVSLRPAGVLVFTVEAHPDDEGEPDWRLHGHGRYSHRRRYLEAVLRGAGFDAIEFEPVVLRHEGAEPVRGWLVAVSRAH